MGHDWASEHTVTHSYRRVLFSSLFSCIAPRKAWQDETAVCASYLGRQAAQRGRVICPGRPSGRGLASRARSLAEAPFLLPRGRAVLLPRAELWAAGEGICLTSFWGQVAPDLAAESPNSVSFARSSAALRVRPRVFPAPPWCLSS